MWGTLTIEHDGGDAESRIFEHLTNIASLFPQLTHSACFRGLTRVHEACGKLDDRRVGRRAPLLLKDDAWFIVGFGWILQDGCDANAVDITAFRPREALAMFPRSYRALRVGVGSSRAVSFLNSTWTSMVGELGTQSIIDMWRMAHFTRVAHLASLLS